MEERVYSSETGEPSTRGANSCPHCLRYQRVLKLFVYNRDKFTCQACQRREADLEWSNFLTLHHLTAQCNRVEVKVDTLENTVTWCNQCHRQYNRQNPNQRLERVVYVKLE